MTYALIGAIESEFNDTNVNTGLCEACKRRLESEAIECFKNWRKNAGWLKDIPIYAVCPTNNVISEKTKEEFDKLNVTYIEDYQEVTEQIIIGQYDDYCTKHQRTGIAQTNPFDTGFIISRRESKFYHAFFKEVLNIMGSDDPDWLKVKAQTGEYYLEEYVVDKIYATGKWDIRPVQKYQIGEWYTPVSVLSDEELHNVYFWHEHLEYDPEYNRIQEKIDFARRMNGK
jgi:hypothetical protein